MWKTQLTFWKSKNLITGILVLLLLLPAIHTLTIPMTAAEEVYPREDTLMIQGRLWSDPENFNPYTPPGWTEAKGERSFLQEFLFVYNLLNDTIVPELATGWEYGPGYDTIKIFLRKGVTWNDGVPFTSKDVVFTFNMLKEHPMLIGSAWAQKWIKDAVAIDDYTVMIWLTEPNARFHWELTSIICFANFWPAPEHIYSKVDPEKFKNWPNPVFTGPYKVIKATSDTVILERDPNYWGTKVLGVVPQPRYVIYKYVGPAEKVAMALEMNELDAGGMDYFVWRDAVKRNPHLIFWSYPGPCPFNLDINIHKYPLSLREVRWAISYAINRSRIVELQGGPALRKPAESWFPDYAAVQRFVYRDVLEQYDTTLYDPAKSIAILEGLGFKRGADGIFVTPNGTRLSFELLGGTPVSPVLLAIAEDLKAIGIEIIQKPMEWAPRWAAMGKLEFDIASSWSQIPGTVTPYTWYDHFSSKYILPIGVDAPEGYNRDRYSNPEFDRILAELGTMTDEDPRAGPLYKKLLTILLRDLPRIPITKGVEYVILNDYYWTNWPSSWGGPNPYAQPQWWWDKMKWVTFKLRSRTLPPVLPPKAFEYVTVWFLVDTPAKTYADGKTYGPFAYGDIASLPKEDVETLLAQGKVSYSPPPPKAWGETLASVDARLRALEGTVATLSTSVAEASSKVDTVSQTASGISGAIAGLTTAVYAAVILSLIAAIAAIAAFIRAKPKG